MLIGMIIHDIWYINVFWGVVYMKPRFSAKTYLSCKPFMTVYRDMLSILFEFFFLYTNDLLKDMYNV